MSRRGKIILIVAAVTLVAIVVWANIARQRSSGIQVDVQTIEERELRAIVSASGKIRAKRSVNVSANANGKIMRIGVDEGERVKRGDFLLQIDPTPAQATVRQIEASIAAAEASLELTEANLEQAKIDLEREEALFAKQLTSEERLQRARTSYNIQRLEAQARKQEIARLRASLVNAKHELGKVSVHADISGLVTQINIEEGENVFVGAFNNPATVLLTVADLSVIEAVVDVDETDIVDVRVGQESVVKVDAYPDTSFRGKVTKVGHSPVTPAMAGAQQQATSFEVIVELTDVIPNVRPGLSCKAEVTTGHRDKAVAVPIQSLTLKKPSDLRPLSEARPAPSDSAQATNGTNDREMQGVFVVEDNAVQFREVRIGIAGDRYFEVLSGLSAEEVVVTGPFREIRRLRNGDRVRVSNASAEGR